MKIVLDTSVYVDYLRSEKGLYPELIKLSKAKRASLYTPSVVVLELWAGESMKDNKLLKITKRLVLPTKIIELSRQLAELAGELLRKDLIFEAEDSIVAATALYLDAQLATGNQRHFSKVPNLRLFKS